MKDFFKTIELLLYSRYHIDVCKGWGVQFRGSAWTHSSEEISQGWRAAGDTGYDLTNPRIEKLTSRTDSNVVNN